MMRPAGSSAVLRAGEVRHGRGALRGEVGYCRGYGAAWRGWRGQGYAGGVGGVLLAGAVLEEGLHRVDGRLVRLVVGQHADDLGAADRYRPGSPEGDVVVARFERDLDDAALGA